MKRAKLILFLIVLFLSSFSFSQKINTVTLAVDEVPSELNFTIDQIIFDDAITDTIGKVIFRKKTSPLIFHGESISQVLNNWFSKNYTSNGREEITLRINKILIVERTPLFQAAISLSFIKASSDGCEILKTITKETYEEQPKTRNKVASPIRGKFISLLIEEAINQFNDEIDDKGHRININCDKLTSYTETFTENVTRKTSHSNEDTLLAYQNYSDIFNSNPVNRSIKLKKVLLKDGSITLYNSETSLENIWGVKLNDTIYKKVGNYLYKVHDFGEQNSYILATKDAHFASFSSNDNFGFTSFIVGGTLSALLIGMDAVNPGVGLLIGAVVGITAELVARMIKKKTLKFHKQEIDYITGLYLMN